MEIKSLVKKPIGIIGIILLLVFICGCMCICCVLSGNLLPGAKRTSTPKAQTSRTPLASPVSDLTESAPTISPTPILSETATVLEEITLTKTPDILTSTATPAHTITKTRTSTVTITRTATRAATRTTAPVVAPTKLPTDIPAPTKAGSCIAAYPDFCIPKQGPRVACKDLGYYNFTVLPPDPLGYDADNDGIGCEKK